MNKADIEKYLQMVGQVLHENGQNLEITLLGGAVMLIEVGNREITYDIDSAYAIDHRKEMIEMPLSLAPSPSMHRWAAFCAAMVEWLCWQDNVPCPVWVKQEYYILTSPWFFYREWDSRAWLLATTPAPFKMRNIFCGNRIFLNKWKSAKVAEKQ